MPSPQPASLRERRIAATRQQILEIAMEMLARHPQEPFSHEAIARKAAVGARTVYRYFPSRAHLMQAMWARVRDDTQTRFPSSESEIVPIVREQFRRFDAHEALVRATLSFSATVELRSRGSLQGRPAFRRSLETITRALPQTQQRRLVAVCLAVYSAPFWQLLRDRGELTGEEAAEAGAWALEVILSAARSETRRVATKRKAGKAKR